MMRRPFLLLIALAISQTALAYTKLSDPAQESRALALQKQFRCLVCQGESLDESNAPLAEDLRQIIRERIAAGDSDAAVKAYLVARYGNFVLMKPPVENDTYLLWAAPLILVLAGGAVLGFVGWRAYGRFRLTGAGDHVLGSDRVQLESLPTFNDMNIKR